MENNADPDQLASSTDLDLHRLQRQGISGFSMTRVNIICPLWDMDRIKRQNAFEHAKCANSNHPAHSQSHLDISFQMIHFI